MSEPHFVVLRQEHIGALAAGIALPDLEAALEEAKKRVISDGEPRYIVQLVYQVQKDPKPHTIVTELAGVPA
ncbi:MAG: hypothetical protein DI597_00905 [Pseudoxanthomonas spadix]|nr:MAG: hypothetical protein DI597_00905 [Pseudoxanthomonas spadix]